MTAPRISLAQQIEAVRFAETRTRSLASGTSIKSLRGRSTEEYDCQRLAAAARTLEWLGEHEAELRAWLALPAGSRAAALAMAQENHDAIARREAIAAAGGPVR